MINYEEREASENHDGNGQWELVGQSMTMEEYLDAEEAGTINTNISGLERDDDATDSAVASADSNMQAGSAGHAMDLPEDWSAHLDEASGCFYYQNSKNFHTQWEKPLTVAQQRAEDALKEKQEAERAEQSTREQLHFSSVTGEIQVTRKLLQPLVGDKPRLSDKLLKRPPFRFIHDIVSKVISCTGFADGLFSPTQIDPKQAATNKEAKVEYLSLIIRCVSIHLGYFASEAAGFGQYWLIDLF